MHVADELVVSSITLLLYQCCLCKVCVELSSTRECSGTFSIAASGLVRHGPSVDMHLMWIAVFMM